MSLDDSKHNEVLFSVQEAEANLRSAIAARIAKRESEQRQRAERESLEEKMRQQVAQEAESRVKSDTKDVRRVLEERKHMDERIVEKEAQREIEKEKELVIVDQQKLETIEAQKIAEEKARYARLEEERIASEKERAQSQSFELAKKQEEFESSAVRAQRVRQEQSPNSDVSNIIDQAKSEEAVREKWRQDVLARKEILSERQKGHIAKEAEKVVSPIRSSLQEPPYGESPDLIERVRDPVEPPARSNQNIASHSSMDNSRVLLVMTVEIGEGRNEDIIVRESARPDDLASEFVSKHSLGNHVVKPLTAHIAANMKQAIDKRKALLDKSETEEQQRNRRARLNPAQAKEVVDRLYPDPNNNSSLSSNRSANDNQNSSSSSKKKSNNEKDFVPKVDKKSKEIVERQRAKQSTNSPSKVHDRLFYDANIRQKHVADRLVRHVIEDNEKINQNKVGMSKGSQRLNVSDNKNIGNYGEYLYEKCRLVQAEKDRKIAERKEKEAMDDDLTFRPQITSAAKRLSRDDQDTWERLGGRSALPDVEARKLAQQEQIREELKSCTFRPQVNEKSNRILAKAGLYYSHPVPDDDPEAEASHFDQLYLDAERRRLRQQEYEQWYPEEYSFHPDIAATQRLRDSLPLNQKSLMERLVAEKKSTATVKKLEEEALVDPETKQEFFHPKTGRAPSVRRNPDGQSIGDYLYKNSALLRDHKERALMNHNMTLQEMANRSYINENSNRLMEKKKKKTFDIIFTMLDEDKDGLVVPSEADFSSVEGNYPGITAMLNDIEDEVNFDEFCFLVDTRLKERQQGTIGDLLVENSHHTEREELEHKPIITQRSEELAKKKRIGLGDNVYDGLYRESIVWEEKRRNREEEQLNSALEDCTFKPNISSRSSNVSKQRIGGNVIERLAVPKTQTSKHGNLNSEEMEYQQYCTFQPNRTLALSEYKSPKSKN